MTSTLAKKPAFWIVVLLASALCMFAVLRYFGDAFSVLDLDVTMSRAQAIDAARRIADARHLTDAKLVDAVASFDGDAAVQTFIELEGGGKPALKPFLGSAGPTAQSPEFTLYRWRVRLYAPLVEREVQVAFTPDGRPAGFFSKVPEKEAGAALSSDAARAIATATATRDWSVDFTSYRALTASAVTRPAGRVDHEFVYERRLEGAPPIGDGRLRLRLVVTGDRLTQLQRFVYVPEAFVRRYETIRSTNNNIAAAAGIVAGVVYGLGGCLVGLIWLMRGRAVRWGPATKWAAIVALLGTGAGLSAISGSWLGYDTATSPMTHLATRIGQTIVGGVVAWLLLTVVFASAEGLGRMAFGSQPQLWRTWRAPSAFSRAVWGRTLAGYAWIGFDLAFIALFYFVVQRYLGWWSPSDTLIDPNILGKPSPWLAPVSMALQAGMMEEALFRAVPLAGAALIGRRFGREKTFIVVALVLQAIVFGCAHANYPGQPAYARPIELFVPSLIWGVVYLRYGLVPGMLFHFGFDLVLMSIPLFVTDVPGLGFDRAMVIGVLALPLLVLVVQRLRAGRLIDLPDSERNAAAGATASSAEASVLAVVDDVEHAIAAPSSATPSLVAAAPSTRRDVLVLGACGLVGIVGLVLRLAQPYDAPVLAIDRSQALAIAERSLADRGVQLDTRWQRSARAVGGSDGAGARFLWREGGAATFGKAVGTTLAPAHWEVRFARFDGDVVERDTWRVVVVDDRPAPDGVRVIEHAIPESRAGKRLTEAEARPLAEAAIAAWLKRAPATLRPISASAAERPNRVDWSFVWADPAVVMPAGGEARIGVVVDGDEVSSVGRFVFVPDAWSREQRTRDDALRIARGLLAILGLAFGVALLVSLVRRIARGEASMRAAWTGAALLGITISIGTWLGIDVAQSAFTIAEPFDAQMLRFTLQWVGIAAGSALLGAMCVGVGTRIASRSDDLPIDAARRAGPDRRRWAAALSLALLAVGVGGFASLAGPAASPREPSVGAAASFAPYVGAFVGELGFAGVASLALLVASVLATRKRWLEIAFVIAIVLGAMLGRAAAPDATVTGYAVAAIGGFLAWLLYRTQVRDRLWIVAPTMLCATFVTQFVTLWRPAYPGARLDAVAGIVGALLGYRLWRWLVDRDRRTS